MAKEAKPPKVYCLKGDLGAGKTAFVKGFAKGLGIDDDITSPTFSITNEYYGKTNLYHFDVYRINSVDDMEDTGYMDYFYGDGISIVEWAEMIEDIIPSDAIWIEIERDYEKSENFRKITVR